MAKKTKRGRKPIAKDRTFVGVVLPDELLDRIDSYAEDNFGIGRSDAIRELLESALRRKGK